MNFIIRLVLLFFTLFSYALTQYNSINRLIGDKSNISTTNCSVIHLRPGYKRLELEIIIFSPNTSLIISEQNFEDFSFQNPGKISSYCEENSMICIFFNQTNKFQRIVINICIEDLFIYVGSDQKNFSPNIVNIRSDYSSSDLGCINLYQNNYLKCSQISLELCKSQCNLDCEYVSCNKNLTNNSNQSFEEFYSMCLPKDLEKNEYKNRCDSFQKSDFVLESDECMNFVPRIIAETKKIPTFLIVFGFSLFFFVFSLIFYRWKLNVNGTPPFAVCDWCPEILYPLSIPSLENEFSF